MNQEDIIAILDSVCEAFPVYVGFAPQPLKLTYQTIHKHPHTCPVCDFPQWDVMFKYPTYWSDNTITHDTMTVNIHNFIELNDVIRFSENISIENIKQLLTLSDVLCEAFNK